jgi:Asp-tRNA(Asn)/Glu-tRNA(Gln) amidotransferase A subunit family amidase
MSDDLTWASVGRLVEMIRAKDVSPVEVLDHFLGRIEEHQPVLHAFDHIDDRRVRQHAKEAETAVLAGDDLASLHGIPLAVKCHLDIEGLPQTPPFGTDIATRDDLVVQRLRAAGALVVGHTGMPVNAPDGRIDHAATARSAWDTERTPGISSAGSASAVAAGLLPAAIGSDGGGSSRLPAAYSGLVGVHPTSGFVPWVDPRGQTSTYTSTIGPIARNVRDAATILAAIAGPDGRDLGGLHVELPDPRRDLELGADGLHLAWTDDFGFARNYAVEESERVIAHVRDAAFGLAGIGASVTPTGESWEDYVDANRVHSFSGIASMGLPAIGTFDPERWEAASALRSRNSLRFRTLFAHHDLLLSPTIHSVAPTLEVFADRIPRGLSLVEGGHGPDSYSVYTAQFNWLRFPAVSVPCGFVDELPVGMQIVGPPGSDVKILRLAHAMLEAFPQDARPPVS